MTIRLADSIPKKALDAWDRDRKEWLSVRGVAVEPRESVCLELLTPEHRKEYMQKFGTWFQDQLDRCQGDCLLREPENREIVEGALQFFAGKRYDLGDYVIMPNHVHLLVVPYAKVSLGELIQSWKRFTTKEINARMGRSGQFWQGERFDHIVRSKRQLERIREYIRENPERGRVPEGEFVWREVEWCIGESGGG